MSADDGAYVREHYKVPAYRGGRVVANGKAGTIVGFDGQYIRVRVDADAVTSNWHPTWRITYFDRLRDAS